MNEYFLDNEAALSGLAGFTDEQIMGMGAEKIRQVVRKAAANLPGAQIAPARANFINRIGLLNKNVQAGLKTNNLQGVDSALHVIKTIGSLASVKMFVDSDTKVSGLCMVNGGKLELDEEMVVSEIQLLYGLHASTPITTAALAGAAVWGPLTDALMLGQFEFKVGNKTLIPWMSMRVFKSDHTLVNATTDQSYAYAISSGNEVGVYKLANPKIIPAQTTIEFNMEWNVAGGANAALMLVLRGTRSYKY